MISTTGIQCVNVDLYDNMKERYVSQIEGQANEIELLHLKLDENAANHDHYLLEISSIKDKNEGIRMDLTASRDECYHLQVKLRKSAADKLQISKQKEEFMSMNEALLAENSDLIFRTEKAAKLERENYDMIQLMNQMHEKEARRDNEMNGIIDAVLLSCQGGQDAMDALEKTKTRMDLAVRSLLNFKNKV